MGHASDKTERTIVIDKTKIISAIIILVMSVLVIIGSVKLIRSFMTVSEFDVTGDSPYEVEDIVNASGIRPGDKLYGIDRKEAEKRIMTLCPYISEVSVRSRFPDRVEIRVESLTASWYVELAGDYYALDTDLRVLEETTDNEKFINGGIPRLTLPHIKSAVVGSPLVFGDSETEIKYANEFMDMVKKTSFKSRLTLVDIDQRFDIYIQVDGVYNVYMGDSKDTGAKLEAVEKALASEKLKNSISAEIYVADLSAVFIDAEYDYTEESEGAETEAQPLG